MKKRLVCRVASGAVVLTVFAAAVFVFQPLPDPFSKGRPASLWTQDLVSPDYNVRGDAQSALQALGEAAVPQLRSMLRARAPIWQPMLASMGGFLPFFKPSQGNDPILARQRGAEMAGLLGSRARELAPDLVPLLVSDQTAAEAERALTRIGLDSVPELEKALTSRSAELRQRAARVLGQFGTLQYSSIAPLIRALHDSDKHVRKEAASTLGRAPLADSRVTAALVRASSDDAPEVRAAALASLGRIGADDNAALAAVRAGFQDAEAIVRLQAAKAYWIIKKDAAAVVPVLVGILSGSEGWQAAYALGEIGPAAASAIPALIRVLESERVPRPYRTPPSSACALGQIGEPAIPALSAVLKDHDASVRMSAVMAFGFMGKKGNAAVPALLKLLGDRDAEVRHATALTLTGIGADGKEVLAGLTDCLNAEDIYMRSAAAEALRQMLPEKQWVLLPE